MNRILNVLSTACKVRRTDATGIAYNHNGKLRIYKRLIPAHLMRFNVPDSFNNHPFYGKADIPFALAHNGVIYNDEKVRESEKLPSTHIKTDSYVAVQLIESKKKLNFESLKYMAEQLKGSMIITVMDSADNLYIVKGDNPLCLYHYPERGLYIYASTEEILKAGLKKLYFNFGKCEKISIESGEILCIDRSGYRTRSEFNDSGLYYNYYFPYRHGWDDWWTSLSKSMPGKMDPAEKQYFEDLKGVACHCGYMLEDIEELYEDGYTLDEIEEFLFTA